MKQKDSFHAKLAFWISLGFWIPLFNIGICIAAIILAVQALKKQSNDPERFGGLRFAIIAIVLAVSGLALTIFGYVAYLMSDAICGSAICQAQFTG
ncbi:MAG: hypothetical protein GY861_15890 [bacterium]|nr:hypothetical protein [bacterium]